MIFSFASTASALCLGGTLAFANGINNRGQVAGASTLAGHPTFDACICDKGKLTDLGKLGGSFLEVIGFNEVGELVGKALLPDELTFHAFVAKKGKMIDLGSHADNPCSYAIQINSLARRSGLTLTAGVSINDRGEIPAQGVLANGERAVLLIPCDEEHPSVDGCDYRTVEEAAQPPNARAAMRPASAHISAPVLWRRNYRFHMPALGSRN